MQTLDPWLEDGTVWKNTVSEWIYRHLFQKWYRLGCAKSWCNTVKEVTKVTKIMVLPSLRWYV